MEMFDTFLGFDRLSRKWFKLIKTVKGDFEDTPFCCIDVTKRFIMAADGKQAIRVEYGPDIPIKTGTYYLSKCRLLISVKKDEAEFPKIEKEFVDTKFTKTAEIELSDQPLVAMACAVAEFNSVINLDLFRETFEAIADLKPGYVRLYGYEEQNKTDFMMIEFQVDDVKVRHVFKPLDFTKEQLVHVDNQPCLFDIKKAG